MSTSKSNALNLSVVFPWLLTLLTAAIDVVDGARSPAPMCHSVIVA